MTASQTMILLAGMHRSGTSAVTRVINLLGVPIPADVMGPSYGNEKGHWESNGLTVLHDGMLAAAGSAWNDLFGVDPGWFDTPEGLQAAQRLRAFVTEHLSPAGLLAAKDPRMAVLLPAWQRALGGLGIRDCTVIPFRSPFEVAASLTARERYFQSPLTWSYDRGLLLWLRHTVAAERATRGRLRSFIAFDALLADWRAELARMGSQLGLQWPVPLDDAAAAVEAFLDRGEKHQNGTAGHAAEPLTALALDVLAALQRCCDDPQGETGTFDRAAAVLEAGRVGLQGYVGDLERDAVERQGLRDALGRLEAERAGWNVARQEAEARRARLEGDLAAGAATIDALRTQDARQSAALAQAAADLADRERRLARIERSALWRLAAALRLTPGHPPRAHRSASS